MEQDIMRELGAVNNLGASQNRFIMFDQTGDKGRIMFDPNRFYEFPNLMANASNGLVAEQAGGVYRDAMASAFTALQNMRDSRPYSVKLCDIADVVGSVPAMANDTDSTSRLSWDGSSHRGAPESSLYDDTEDLEALLYSDDDEYSTGHSPSDVTCDEHPFDASDQDEISSPVKDGNVSSSDGESGEVDFVPKTQKQMVEKLNRFSGFPSGACEVKPAGTTPSQAGPVRHKRAASKALSGHLSAKKKMRKEKIRQTVKVLQNIIPGGDCMDPAVILDEAIHYMKSLQTKVVELEASRQVKKT